jgi:hypothetical protein
VNIDENPARLWNWHDIQFLRGIKWYWHSTTLWFSRIAFENCQGRDCLSLTSALYQKVFFITIKNEIVEIISLILESSYWI